MKFQKELLTHAQESETLLLIYMRSEIFSAQISKTFGKVILTSSCQWVLKQEEKLEKLSKSISKMPLKKETPP